MSIASSPVELLEPSVAASPRAEVVAVPATRRDVELDAMRFLAGVGVVWLHAAVVLPSGAGRFAVPMYVVAAVLLTTFSLRKRPEQSLIAYLGKRWLRLYPAFLFWCVVYESLRQAKTVLKGNGLRLDPLDFIGGTQEHLWYLPYLLVATVAIVPMIVLAIRNRPARRTIAVVSAAIGFAMAITPVPHAIASIPVDSPWHFLQPVWWATPSLLLAMALACVALDRGTGLGVPRSLGWLGVAMFVSGAIVNWGVLDQPHLLAATLSGVGAVWLAGAGLLPRAFATTVAPLGANLGLGIYLGHVLFLRIFVMAAELAHLPASAMSDVASFAFSLAGAIALSAILRRSRWTRWTIGL